MSIEATPEARSERAWEPGRSTEARRAPRRRTFARVRVLAGPALEAEAVATDFSADGAFIRTRRGPERGARLALELDLPTDPRPVKLTAVVVRAGERGIGVRFEEVSARDRTRLRSHAGFYEMDEAIVRVQRALPDELPGNLLPLGERVEVEAVLAAAAERRVAVTAIPAQPGAPQSRGVFVELSAALDLVHLADLEPAIPPSTRAIYVVFTQAPLVYAFEGIIAAGRDGRSSVLFPERIYLTERRGAGRQAPEGGVCEVEAPPGVGGVFRLPLLDLGAAGASVRLEPGFFFVPGLRLPAFTVVTRSGHPDEERRRVAGATVRYVVPTADGKGLRAGLRFEDDAPERETFRAVKRRDAVEAGIAARLRRGFSLLRGRVAGLFSGPRRNGEVQAGEDVEVVRYRNRRGDTVAAIIDANFDTRDPTIRPDLAVVIAPAFLKRKEAVGLLARTLVDDLGRDGRRIVCLRFDATHTIGESAVDPTLAAGDRPYYRWTFGLMKADMQASLAYVDRRFRPARRALVSLSISAISARKVVLEAPPQVPVDLWVAPYGCPDAQDMLRNYLGGLDLFEVYRAGGHCEPLLIHGRPIDADYIYPNAMQEGFAFLEDGRADLSRIGTPVVWILGEYDCWVTHSRVRAMLEAPGGGEREVFVLPTGHVLRSAPEALELFKLVSESVARHLFNVDRPARDPDLGRYHLQSEAEWARVKRLELVDPRSFWHAHLFGGRGRETGAADAGAPGADDLDPGPSQYDVLLDLPDYREFLKTQVRLLDPKPGEDIADLGCGTGSLLLAMLDAYPEDTAPASITFLDLVPEAVHATALKLAARFRERGQKLPPYKGIVADLEVSRLSALVDFLEGRVAGIEALADRLEGFERATARKLARRYGKEIHAILRGLPAPPARLRELCPDLTEEEAEAVLEIGRAVRFLRGDTLPEDRLPGVAEPRTPVDLRLRWLRLGKSGHGLGVGLPDAGFDRIGCSLVLSYLWDPIVPLRLMGRALRPGGTLVLSVVRRDFDLSKLYLDQAARLQGDPRKLDATRSLASFMGKLVELEEDGRFRFYDPHGLVSLVEEAGFVDPKPVDGFGLPPTAVIVQCRKRR